MPPKTIQWVGGLDGHVELIDQTLLPQKLRVLAIRDADSLREAIRALRVRGAPAIGVAAAMGAVLAVRDATSHDELFEKLAQGVESLGCARPTAVNLSWALERMCHRAESSSNKPLLDMKLSMLGEAQAIRDEDARMCRTIGEAGAHLIRPGSGVLTYCNAGSLATAEFGTALAPMYVAHERGVPFRVFAAETRPLLQGSRLTAWELSQAGIDVTVICDNAVGSVMRSGQIDLVITGADRIAANGDTANKIGTYGVAMLAQGHEIPFYVAAPGSTFDLKLSGGSAIPIEVRSEEEIGRGFGRVTVPKKVRCFNPAFDVTPAGLIHGMITDGGVLEPVTHERIRDFFSVRRLQSA